MRPSVWRHKPSTTGKDPPLKLFVKTGFSLVTRRNGSLASLKESVMCRKLPSKAHNLESFGEPRSQGYPDTNEIWAKCFFMMKDCRHVTDQIVKRWWRYEEERLQIGVAFVRTLEKKNERLSKSLMFIWYFLLFAFVHGVDSDYIGEVHGGLNFLSVKNPTFSYLPVSAHTKEVWGRLAAWNWENQCCMGRQSEGSTWRGAEDRMLLHNSWAFLAAHVHFPVRTPAHNMPQQCSTNKALYLRRQTCTLSDSHFSYHFYLVWPLCSLVLPGRFK